MNKFKIGDEVICIDGPPNDCIDYPGGGWRLGFRFRVRKYTTGNGMFIYWNGYDGCGVYEPALRLVSKNQYVGTRIKKEV